MSGLCEYAPSAEPLPEFGAKVYKIARDPQGNRLTYLKVTGGQLRVKDVPFAAEQSCTGKVNQIRKYSGEKYELVQTVSAGEVCAVTGLEGTYPGQGDRRAERIFASCIRTCHDISDRTSGWV